MKRFILVFFVLLAGCAVLAARPADAKKEKKASIKLDSTVANIGTFPRNNSKKTVVYTFKNVGNDKLVFYDAAPDCGCIKAQLPDKPVKPGKKGKIIVNYNGGNKSPGNYNHRINFACSGSPAYFSVRLRFVLTEK